MRIPSGHSKRAPAPRAQKSIVLGFCAIAMLFFVIVAVWLAMASNHNASIQQIHISELQQQLIFTMRNAAYERNLALFRMATLQDPFARDTEYLQFKAAAVKFIVARQQLLESHLDENIADNWQRLKPGIRQSETLQNTIVDLITEENNTAALQLIHSQFIPLQRQVSKELTTMLASARENMDGKLSTARSTTRSQYQLVLLLVLAATSIGYVIARTVLQRSQEAENVLLSKNRQIRAFSAVTSSLHKTVDEQIEDILQLGCGFLGMKCGLLIRAEPDGATTVLSRYCNEGQIQPLRQQAIADILTTAVKKIAVSELTLDTLMTNEPGLAEALQRQYISTLIMASIDISGPASAKVAFIHDKKVSLGYDSNDMIQLIGNKLAVLMEQQETLSQLQNAKHTAETANKAKNAFLNHITHKLQPSLSAIIGHGESLQQQLRLNDHTQYLNDLGKIDVSSRRLHTLISNLLDLTKLESGSMEFAQQPFDIESVLQEATKNLESLMYEKDGQLGTMIGDSARIHQVIASLLSFLESQNGHGKIQLTAWREQSPEDDWLYLEVKHNGTGMSKKQLNQLFKLAADPYDREKYSPQVDLAISKKLCEQLGGDILVDSKPDSGTIFTVCLPCNSQQHSQAAVN